METNDVYFGTQRSSHNRQAEFECMNSLLPSNLWVIIFKTVLVVYIFLPFCRTANHRGRITWTKYLQTFWYVVEKSAFNSRPPKSRRTSAVRAADGCRNAKAETKSGWLQKLFKWRVLTHFNDAKDSFSLLSTTWRHHSKSTIKSVYGFSYASAECCKCQIETQIKDSLSCAVLSRSSRQAGKNDVNMRPINSEVHKRSLCVMRKSRSETLFELNLKWIQIMFFAATRFMLFSDSRLSVSVRHSVCDAGTGEN